MTLAEHFDLFSAVRTFDVTVVSTIPRTGMFIPVLAMLYAFFTIKLYQILRRGDDPQLHPQAGTEIQSAEHLPFQEACQRTDNPNLYITS